MEVWHAMLNAAEQWYVYQHVTALQLLVAVALAVAFGALWLTAHWPPIFKHPWFWVLGVGSAFFTMGVYAFIHTPLQFYYSKLVHHFLDSKTVVDWIMLLGIPSVIISGLVEEGAKMVPMVLYWRKQHRRITPAMGLAIGAVVGAGFGIFDAFQIFASQFGSGWTTAALGSGFNGIAGFWIRFFTIGLHMALSAMVGYGLARGKGWQYFLVASGFHAVFLYGNYFYQQGYFGVVQLGVFVACVSIVMTAIVLVVRYRQRRDYPGEAAYDPVLYLEYEERYAAEEAAARAEMAETADTVVSGIEDDSVSPPEAPPAEPENEEKPD